MAIYSDEEQDQNVLDWNKENEPKKTPTHRVVLEIEVDADSPLEAAKTIQEWLDAADNKWQFYVQEEGSDKVFSVDLAEDESCAVLELMTKYQPLIK